MSRAIKEIEQNLKLYTVICLYLDVFFFNVYQDVQVIYTILLIICVECVFGG